MDPIEIFTLKVDNPYPLTKDQIVNVSELYHEWWSVQQDREDRHELMDVLPLFLVDEPSLDMDITQGVHFLEDLFNQLDNIDHLFDKKWSFSYIVAKRHTSALTFTDRGRANAV